jgi:hypothetical protein
MSLLRIKNTFYPFKVFYIWFFDYILKTYGFYKNYLIIHSLKTKLLDNKIFFFALLLLKINSYSTFFALFFGSIFLVLLINYYLNHDLIYEFLYQK